MRALKFSDKEKADLFRTTIPKHTVSRIILVIQLAEIRAIEEQMESHGRDIGELGQSKDVSSFYYSAQDDCPGLFTLLEFGYNTKSPSVIDSYKVNMSYLLLVVDCTRIKCATIHTRTVFCPTHSCSFQCNETETITSFTGLPSSSADLSCAHCTPVFLFVRPYPNNVGLSLLTPNAKFEWPNTPWLSRLAVWCGFLTTYLPTS